MNPMRFAPLVALTCVASVALAAPAAAKGPIKTSTHTGNDISYPQCGKPYPSGSSFGIVGLNGGLANNNNACFAGEYAWAQSTTGLGGQPPASIYVNTGNPSGAGPVWWPTSNTFYDAPDGTDSNTPFAGSTQVDVPVPSYGSCTSSNDAGCSYVYGWAKAYEDFNHRNVAAPAATPWWLDVETSNSWETPGAAYPTAYQANIADLKAMTDYLQSQGARVGIYSTGYQWGQITGGTISAGSADPFAGIPNWEAGASSSTATKSCTNGSNFTYASKVTLVQYVSGRLDYDVVCP
ncbi:MAG TPA: hypothetical protein VGN48_07560 [Pedococcus sp.]|jgi:hypothetical protein|nr:hypothetical protein [Pedococcus sp.]